MASITRSARIEISVGGEREFGNELFGMSARALHIQPAFESILEILREGVRQQYASKGARTGDPWKPLNEQYRAWKISKGLDPRRMLATHDLYDSLAHETGDSIAVATNDELAFGSKRASKKGKPVLAFHQSRKPRSKIPYRPVVKLTDGDRQEIREVFRDHIISLRRAAL